MLTVKSSTYMIIAPVCAEWKEDGGLYTPFCYDGIGMGTPFHFVLDPDHSMTLVMQCCHWEPFFSIYSIPWNSL